MSILEKVRLKLLAQKCLQQGFSTEIIRIKLLQDSYLLEVEETLGKERALRVASEVMKKAGIDLNKQDTTTQLLNR
ncbi:MAG: hypothetical protein QNJ54_18070 [Prochloraceae cyanobacterium]|nr:hypothetical protein [Prochloraceae cyanobacterium]